MQEQFEAFKDDHQSSSASRQFNHLPDSDLYIRKLETRLSKVKGSEQNLTSKGMISVLQKARDDYMSRLMSSANQMSSLSSEIDREVSVSYVEKKLFPEKIGVTYEELQRLVESDVLAKLSAENSSECLTDIPVDR